MRQSPYSLANARPVRKYSYASIADFCVPGSGLVLAGREVCNKVAGNLNMPQTVVSRRRLFPGDGREYILRCAAYEFR